MTDKKGREWIRNATDASRLNGQPQKFGLNNYFIGPIEDGKPTGAQLVVSIKNKFACLHESDLEAGLPGGQSGGNPDGSKLFYVLTQHYKIMAFRPKPDGSDPECLNAIVAWDSPNLPGQPAGPTLPPGLTPQ